jgi:hypothetical protein
MSRQRDDETTTTDHYIETATIEEVDHVLDAAIRRLAVLGQAETDAERRAGMPSSHRLFGLAVELRRVEERIFFGYRADLPTGLPRALR